MSHTHCIDNITCILGMTSHSPYMWHLFHYARHHILTLWPQTTVFMSSQQYIWHLVHCICVITSTVLMISHQLWFWDHIRYSSQHKIHCIRNDTKCMTSQPLLSWHQIPYISHHIPDLLHVVPYSCDITETMLWIHVNIFNIKHMVLRQYSNIYVITTSVCVSVWSHTL